MTGVFVMSSRALSTEREGDSFECSVETIVLHSQKTVAVQHNQLGCWKYTWRLPLSFARRRQHGHGEDVVHIFLVQRTFLRCWRRIHQVAVLRMVIYTPNSIIPNLPYIRQCNQIWNTYNQIKLQYTKYKLNKIQKF